MYIGKYPSCTYKHLENTALINTISLILKPFLRTTILLHCAIKVVQRQVQLRSSCLVFANLLHLQIINPDRILLQLQLHFCGKISYFRVTNAPYSFFNLFRGVSYMYLYNFLKNLHAFHDLV